MDSSMDIPTNKLVRHSLSRILMEQCGKLMNGSMGTSLVYIKGAEGTLSEEGLDMVYAIQTVDYSQGWAGNSSFSSVKVFIGMDEFMIYFTKSLESWRGE